MLAYNVFIRSNKRLINYRNVCSSYFLGQNNFLLSSYPVLKDSKRSHVMLTNSCATLCKPPTTAMNLLICNESTEKALTNKEKLKRAVAAYGSTVIVFHITISLMSLGACYLLVASGLDITTILEYLNLGNLASKATTSAGTFVVAYAIHKVFLPVRVGITLTATPFIVRYLRRIGILKVTQTKK